MKDISHRIVRYRECSRNLWNTYFYHELSEKNKWEMKDKFDDICTQLFLAIVFAPLGKSSSKKSPSYMKSQKPIDILSIIPLIKSGIPIRINREIEQSGYWDHPVDFIKPNDVELQFIDFFDFDTLGVREFEYYLVHIKKSNIDPSLKGRNGLVKVNHAKVILI